MRKILASMILGVLLAVCGTAMASFFNNLGVGGPVTSSSAILQSRSTTKGALPCPTMSQVQREAIVTPTDGLCVVDSVTGRTLTYFGTAWNENGNVFLTDAQALTTKIIDADNNTISNLAHGAEVDNPSSGVHGVTGSVVGTTDAQTLSAKTLTSPAINGANQNFGTATDTNRLLLPTETTTNLDGLTDTAGLIAYDSTVGKPVYNSGAGWIEVGTGEGGTGSVNTYFSDTFETSISNVGTPVDVSGNDTLTSSHETTNPIVGLGSLRISKSAADGTGDYVDIGSFTTTADFPVTIFSISFKANNTLADDVLEVKWYDGTTLHTLDGDGLIKGGDGRFYATVQTPPGAGTHSLRFVVASTNATAGTIDIDNLEIGEFPIVSGAVVTEWKDYTPDWTGSTTNPVLGNGLLNGRWRRVGDTAEIEIGFAAGSTTTFGSGSWLFSVPSGLSIDYGKIASPYLSVIAKNNTLAYLYDSETATNRQIGIPQILDSFPNIIRIYDQEGKVVDSVSPFTWATGDGISLVISVPIVGWSAQAQLGVDVGGRDVYFGAAKSTSTQTITADAGATLVTLDVELTDNVGSFASNVFTAPETGLFPFKYNLQGRMGATPGGLTSYMLVNGSGFRYGLAYTEDTGATAQQDFSHNGHADIYLEKNQTVGLYAEALAQNVNIVGATAQDRTSLYGHNKNSNNQIFRGIPQNFIASNTSGQEFANDATVLYDSISLDDHSAYSAGVITARRGGIAKIEWTLRTVSFTPVVGELIDSQCIKGASTVVCSSTRDVAQSTTDRNFSITGRCSFPVVTGDTFFIKLLENITANQNLINTAGANTISIKIE